MKAIIFDFDGVLHDTFELGYKINAEIFGTNFTKGEYKDFFNGNIRSHKKVTRNAVDAFFIHQNKAFESLKVRDEVRTFLESVCTQFSLFIISSNQEIALNMYIENNELTHIFREVFGIETHKSKIEKFKYLFEKYNLQADNCVFITDTLGDILEGNKVGIKTIAVDFGFHERERLEKGNPYKIVASFDEIQDTLNKM